MTFIAEHANTFHRRRQSLMQRMTQLGGNGVAVIPTASEKTRNRDASFPFRPDSYFHYLSGFPEPEAVIVLLTSQENSRSILFCREKDMEREIWDGFRYGPEAARDLFGFDETYPITSLESELPKLIANQDSLWYALGEDKIWDDAISQALNTVRSQARSGKRPPETLRDIRSPLDAMRLIKDDSEIATMRRAAEISAVAHCRAMRATQPGRHEYEIEAELLHEFRRQGSQFPAYTSIVAGGANACVLHYVGNDQALRDGDLLLIDAGAELDGYAADITRTFPVNGRFSGPQKDLYELVLASQTAAIAATKPGAHFMQPHEAALTVLAQGFLDLGLLSGTLEEVMEKESYKQFYMHRTSHWLGRDVHDAGEYKDSAGNWQTLTCGMVLTMEPGCYVRPADNVPEAFWNIGIRIEDDAVVTAQGCDILSNGVPKTVAEIEALMRG